MSTRNDPDMDKLTDLRDRLATCLEAEGDTALAQELRERWEREIEVWH